MRDGDTLVRPALENGRDPRVELGTETKQRRQFSNAPLVKRRKDEDNSQRPFSI